MIKSVYTKIWAGTNLLLNLLRLRWLRVLPTSRYQIYHLRTSNSFFAFVSWEYWVYHLMSSHLNMSKSCLFMCFLLWFDLCCLGSPTSSALRVLEVALPAVATSYSSMSTELNRPSHPSQLRFVLLKEELPARIFGLERVEPGPSTRKCVQYFDLQDIQVEVIQKWSPIFINVYVLPYFKIRYNWSILLEFLF